MGVSQELIKGTVVPVVLALLKDRPRYGYEMVQLVNAPHKRGAELERGHALPGAAQLEADGLVSAEWREGAPGRLPRGGRLQPRPADPRRYYALTRAGRRSSTAGRRNGKHSPPPSGEFLGAIRRSDEPRAIERSR